jgi:hypothetical protein
MRTRTNDMNSSCDLRLNGKWYSHNPCEYMIEKKEQESCPSLQRKPPQLVHSTLLPLLPNLLNESTNLSGLSILDPKSVYNILLVLIRLRN